MSVSNFTERIEEKKQWICKWISAASGSGSPSCCIRLGDVGKEKQGEHKETKGKRQCMGERREMLITWGRSM